MGVAVVNFGILITGGGVIIVDVEIVPVGELGVRRRGVMERMRGELDPLRFLLLLLLLLWLLV